MQITYEKLSEYIIKNHDSFSHRDGAFHVWTYECGNTHISFQKNFESKKKVKDDNRFSPKFNQYSFVFQDVSSQNPNSTYLLINELDKIIDIDSTLGELGDYGLDECATVLRSVLYEIEANSLDAELPKKTNDKNKSPKI